MSEGRRDSSVHRQGTGKGGDEMQDVGVPGLSGDTKGLREDGSALWNTLLRYMRVHHAHRKAGREYADNCFFCAADLAEVAKAIEAGTSDEGDSVVQDSGVDEKGTAALPPDDGPPEGLKPYGNGWWHSDDGEGDTADVGSGDEG